MFTHKSKNLVYIDSVAHNQNVITLSRGFANNLFGE
jgi:hypothetical protein